ncbi:ead/Ea22-like family protein [Salmonella enterica subsp. enterica]|uniref:Ead/Ea22-like family protein n=1 Tax=Salmonella enterica TaxID=28901 RepID=A0A5U2LQC4_SALER|nr:ead/Ea22-like family protein [Salmonella enterica]ECH9037293.1 ead/Ea22-like family protein [Salmonella enterica subsp. enterica]
MSEINYQALREAAEKATKGRWAVEFDDEIYSTDGVNHEQIAMVFSENEARDAAFIAAANPATVLALLDELETAEKRIAELEARQVVLPRTQDVHPLGPQSAKIFCDFHRNIINRCADEIRKVGVNVSIKGE